MKVHLIGSAYVASDSMPHLIVSYKQFDEMTKQIQNGKPLLIDGLLAAGETAAEAEGNIFEAWGLGYESAPSIQLKKLEERLQSAEEALRFYSEPNHVLSGSDYQMYATSSSRQAYDDNGEKARAHFERFKEEKDGNA